jgi:hypothetical protein
MVASRLPMRLVSRSCITSFAALAIACGTSDSTGSTGTSSSESTAEPTTSTTESSSSSGGDTSTGEIPEACPDVALETGIVGRTDRRTCEILAECVMPESGVSLSVYDSNPQMGGGDGEPGMLDAAAVPLGDLNSGVGGRFEFQLPSGTYYVCANEAPGMVYCSEGITLSEDDPVWFAAYETGMGSSWNNISCGL